MSEFTCFFGKSFGQEKLLRGNLYTFGTQGGRGGGGLVHKYLFNLIITILSYPCLRVLCHHDLFGVDFGLTCNSVCLESIKKLVLWEKHIIL